MSRKFGESDLDRRVRESALDRIMKRAGEIMDRDKPATSEQAPAGAGETTSKFGTGAVRSKDAEGERYDLISPIGLRAVAETCAEGAGKYGDFNWEKGMPAHDLLNHAMRHVYKFLSGDRSEDHLPHAAWNVLGAIHSLELWPHLNAGHLRGPGCTPPGADEPIGTLPTDDERAAEMGKEFYNAMYADLKATTPSAIARNLELIRSIFAIADPAPAGDGAKTPPSKPTAAVLGDWLAYMDEPSGNGYTGLPVEPGGFCGDFELADSPAPADPADILAPARLHLLAHNWRGRPRPVLYLSGPMSGIPAFNFPAFNAAADALRNLGFPVVNPADFGADPAISWADCLQRDLAVMGYANIVVQLPGWESSAGASLESHVAGRLGKAIVSYADAGTLGSLLA